MSLKLIGTFCHKSQSVFKEFDMSFSLKPAEIWLVVIWNTLFLCSGSSGGNPGSSEG